MKNSKLTLWSLLILILVGVSCSKDDETPVADIENAQISLIDDPTVLEIPSGLQSSSDQNAQSVNAILAGANASMSIASSAFSADFQGAEKSNTPITPAGGRVEITENDVIVYTYSATTSDPLTGQSITISIAYQIEDAGDKWKFDLFWKFDGGEWLRYISAEESKTSRVGKMDIYLPSFTEDSSEVIASYTWSENAAGTINFTCEIADSTIRYDIVSNVDGSGTLTYYLDSTKYAEYIWASDGSGSYQLFDDNGNIIDSGVWS